MTVRLRMGGKDIGTGIRNTIRAANRSRNARTGEQTDIAPPRRRPL